MKWFFDFINSCHDVNIAIYALIITFLTTEFIAKRTYDSYLKNDFCKKNKALIIFGFAIIFSTISIFVELIAFKSFCIGKYFLNIIINVGLSASSASIWKIVKGLLLHFFKIDLDNGGK